MRITRAEDGKLREFAAKVGIPVSEYMRRLYLGGRPIIAKNAKTCIDPPCPDDLSPKIGYLRRILDYAFGAQGDIWVIGQRPGKPEVEKFNKETEIIDYYMKKPEQTASQQQYSHQRFRSR